MGTYGLQGVIKAWELGKITTEQAVGQILLLLLELNQRVGELERRQSKRRRESPPNRLDKS
jgi:hypothetical protein